MNSTSDQYRIIASGAGWFDKRARGRLRISGRDAVPFLHALVTSDVASLVPGQGTYAVYLTPQGRMIADLAVYHRGDHLIVDVPREQAASLAARLDQLIFTEDVSVLDESATLVQISVVGGTAAAAVASALDLPQAALETMAIRSHADSGDRVAARTDDTEAPSFDLILPTGDRSRVVAALEAAGAIAASHELAELLRIEAGRPAFGVDMTEETIPLEAGLLDRAISLTKGCYVGQEVIVRVLHRGGGRVARKLVRLKADAGGTLAAGVAIHDDSGEAGRVTSAAHSPRDDRDIGLGYLRRESAEVGRRFRAGDATVEVVALAG